MNPLSGYIELELAGEVLPFKFGSNAWSLFCEKRKLEFHEIFKSGVFGKFGTDPAGKETYESTPDMFALQDIYFFAYVTAIRMKKEIQKFNFEEFIGLLDDTPEAMIKLQKVLFESKMMGYTFKELADKGDGKANFQN
jgi:hypothetical protein